MIDYDALVNVAVRNAWYKVYHSNTKAREKVPRIQTPQVRVIKAELDNAISEEKLKEVLDYMDLEYIA